MPYKDPEKRRRRHREYMRERYKNKEFAKEHVRVVRAYKLKMRSKYRELITEFRKRGCAVCTEKEPCCLIAHHVNPREKEFRIAQAWVRGIGIERFKRELTKCACLCENCHRKVHAGIIKFNAGRAPVGCPVS